jgi:hypothetical protein
MQPTPALSSVDCCGSLLNGWEGAGRAGTQVVPHKSARRLVCVRRQLAARKGCWQPHPCATNPLHLGAPAPHGNSSSRWWRAWARYPSRTETHKSPSRLVWHGVYATLPRIVCHPADRGRRPLPSCDHRPGQAHEPCGCEASTARCPPVVRSAFLQHLFRQCFRRLIRNTPFLCQFTRRIAGGLQRPSRASGLGAYSRIVTPSTPLAGEGSQLDSLSAPGLWC